MATTKLDSGHGVTAPIADTSKVESTRIGRFDQLDSLRGLAALSVVIAHFMSLYPSMYDRPFGREYWAVKVTPLHAVWGGHAAVVLFFVLSGFVLSLPFYRGPVDLRGFFVKRVCRLYLPYIVAVAAGLAVRLCVEKPSLPGLSGWYHRDVWNSAIDTRVIVEHVLMVGGIRFHATLVPVIWSLIHEMRLSLLFPIIMACVQRFSWKTNIVAGAVLAVTGFLFRNIGSDYYGVTGVTYTLQYVVLFVIGALLAKHMHPVTDAWRHLPPGRRVAYLIFGLLLYSYPYWVIPSSRMMHVSIVNDSVTAAGSVILIVASLGSDRMTRFLLIRPVLGIGRSSYSIYLFHTLILLTVLSVLADRVGTPAILAVAAALLVPVCALSYYVVELRSIRLGHRLAKSQRRGQHFASHAAGPQA